MKNVIRLPSAFDFRLGFCIICMTFLLIFFTWKYRISEYLHAFAVEDEVSIPWPVVKYPRNYGAEKYLQRKATSLVDPSCKIFSGSSAAEILRRIKKRNKEEFLPNYATAEQTNDSSANFGGNLDERRRKKYFNYSSARDGPFPCGFARKDGSRFAVSEEDRRAMEDCRDVAVVSALFGAYDKIRQHRNVKRITARSVCFFIFVDNQTLTDIINHELIKPEYKKLPKKMMIGLWRVILVREMAYNESVMNGIVPKYLIHRLLPNCKYTIWVDAKIQLVEDPLQILGNLLLAKDAHLAVAAHPYNVHTVEEAIFTVRWRKWRKEAVRYQMEKYCEDGLQPWSPLKLPYSTDVVDTAVLVRRHGHPTDMFSCLMFNEIAVFGARDQMAFAFVRDMVNPKLNMNIFPTFVFNAISNEYRHYRPAYRPPLQRASASEEFSFGFRGSACRSYLQRMWNSSHKFV